MKGKEIIKHITNAEMPDIEQVRERCVMQRTEHRKHSAKQPFRKLLPIAVSVCIAFAVMAATVANAATGGAIWDTIKHTFMAGGGNVGFDEERPGVIWGEEGKTVWLVEEFCGKLVLNVNGEKINITKSLKSKGYYYYEFSDNLDISHRIYIVKNNGELRSEKNYRWYSQFEWLPKYGYGNGINCSAALANAISFAQFGEENGDGDLDAMLEKYLGEYWDKK